MKTAGRDPAIDGLPAILLRASCGCAKCRDAASGQRLRSVTDLPADVSVASTAVAGSTVEVVFGPDGHRAVFSREWLADQRRPPDDDRTEDAKRLWAATDPAAAAGLRGRDWPRYLAGPAIRGQCLAALMRDGFFLLRNVPCQPEAVLAVAGTMGYVRETSYGRLFDVRVEATPAREGGHEMSVVPEARVGAVPEARVGAVPEARTWCRAEARI